MRFDVMVSFWVAHASRVLAMASSPSRTFIVECRFGEFRVKESPFRRDAETNTRDACATRTRKPNAS
jgi:hypothetical protein